MMRPLQLTDMQLTNCTKWVAPNGDVLLPLPHTIPFYYQIGAGLVQPDLELATPSESAFVCKVISSTGVTPGTLVQIQWPDGRYLSNPGVDFFSFVGTGRRGRLLDPYKYLPPSSKIKINLDNSAVGSAANMEIYFEGVLLVKMVKQ